MFYILVAGAYALAAGPVRAQVSPDCGTAIPICSNTPVNGGTNGYGTDDFSGATSSGCLETTLSGNIESNSAWYRFRTGASGQLGFNVGFDASEDWDFALYRASDCGSLGDPVRCNFFDNREGASYMGVGEDPTGRTDSYQYEAWLDVQPGEDYYLLINNFSNTNSGFSIQFSGNIFNTNPYDALDCSIIDNLLGPPVAACEGDTVTLDGTTQDATAYQWFSDSGSGFAPISGANGATYDVTLPGVYRIRVTLPDASQIISDVQVGFDPVPQTYQVDDFVVCSEYQPLDLSPLIPQALGPQDPDRFRVTFHASAAEAQAGTNPLPLTYSGARGTHILHVRTTSLANPSCYDASETSQLDIMPDPMGVFPQDVFICADGQGVEIGPDVYEPDATYTWSTGETTPKITVYAPGTYTLTTEQTLGGSGCGQQRDVRVLESVQPRITGVVIEDLQAANRVTIQTDLDGDFLYALDDGPFQASPVFEGVPAGTHIARMRDLLGCGEVSETITVVGYPPFFTPNGDGRNDHWHIAGIERLTDPEVLIFDRYGKLLKQLDASGPGWDGTFMGRMMPGGDYWFRLTYTDTSGQRVEARFLDAHFALKQ